MLLVDYREDFIAPSYKNAGKPLSKLLGMVLQSLQYSSNSFSIVFPHFIQPGAAKWMELFQYRYIREKEKNGVTIRQSCWRKLWESGWESGYIPIIWVFTDILLNLLEFLFYLRLTSGTDRRSTQIIK